MLNDLSTFTRLSMFFQLAGVGLAGGALLGAVLLPLDPDLGGGVLVLLGAALSLVPAWAVGHAVALRRLERRFWDEVVAGSQELVAGRTAATLPARVVRRRRKRVLPAFTLATGRSSGPSLAVAATVVGDGPPRRVGLLLPVTPQLWPRGTALLVAVHPDRPEVAVLEDRVPADAVAAGASDPRWSQRLPSDAQVVGGWVPLVGVAFVSLLVWGGVGYGLARLLVV